MLFRPKDEDDARYMGMAVGTYSSTSQYTGLDLSRVNHPATTTTETKQPQSGESVEEHFYEKIPNYQYMNNHAYASRIEMTTVLPGDEILRRDILI